ncbi:MFS transporter [Kitasatospora sp. NPDC059973]|uniref:MFS transporter n=1 Tax=Kitasatospora sp. NPDC059973 TaxID=3347020 RepID=UPI0036BAB13F
MSAGARGSLLRRNRDFRLLFTGEVAGRFGGALTNLSLPLIAVGVLHAGAFEAALLVAAKWVPWLLIGLPAGAWVDRMRRRTVMLVSTAVSLVLHLTVPAAAVLGVLTAGQLLAVATATGAAEVFFQTAYTAYLPTLVAEPDRAEGNAALHGSASAAQIVGLGAGGAAAQTFGPVNSLLANTATFLLSLLSTAAIRTREPAPAARRGDHPGTTPTPRPNLRREVSEGLRLITHDVWLRTFALHGALANMALMAYQSIQVVFLVEQARLSDGAIGAVVGAAGAGGVLGAAVARRVGAAIGTARALMLFLFWVPMLALLIPLTGPGAGVACYVLGGFAVSAGIVAGNVLRATFQQRHVPARVLGRISASGSFLNYGAIPLGALASGATASAVGVVPAMWLATAAVPLAAAVLWLSPLPHLRDLPDGSAAPATPAASPTPVGRP